MAGLSRFLSVLRLFDENKSTWTVPDIAQRLKLPVSTVYRTVRELTASDFLEPAHEGHYRLGASFVEFDRRIRLTDPLVRFGQPMLREIGAQARLPCIALLARLYGDTVMCVADFGTDHEGIISSYERGRPMPLTRGATSKMILAELPGRRLKKLLSIQAAESRRPFRLKPEELMEELAFTKKRGFSITRGEIDKGLMGIAAPVVAKDMGIAASLSLVVRAADIDASIERRLTLLLVSSASLLTAELTHPIDRRHGAARAG
ncbi:IclR family transcriptional regulator [Pseudorhodoplanes sinuspersici]|uniref:Uncharacterized protein n=1 Tax=Pseudorhodoplanes sinuspersici TaxID=1235591 RepID=A0A1W6ZQD6_9HYPH|nr:IclR family transcriptional regulator C-terminal domain-containing protein [Pseudorhodoplanes sinuspersici]ARP99613.1 hypothetical protein CAK95_11345 [Pseudorhodoplanes sinuspersici]RKE70587.1 IclR family transcriptional regulator [Pseudorhodoplanes sinuspersici]